MEHPKGYACVHAAQPRGMDAELVTVEADLSRGLHAFSIVGLADKAVAEARDRISSAIKSAGFKPPKATNRRIVLSLSPASLRKDGAQYDLPLAVAYLVAAGHIPVSPERMLFCGELGLDGSVRPIGNVLAHMLCAKAAGITQVFVPAANIQEALLLRGVRAHPVSTLSQLIEHLNGRVRISPAHGRVVPSSPLVADTRDFGEIRGQESAKRALLIAAAGRHSVMLHGPPGTGKTMLARALPSILPPLSEEEMLSATAIHAAAGELASGTVIRTPPFRAPHHTISTAGMVGGRALRPGEVTLAHTGVLFMDEFTEFDARTIDALRQPLEDRTVSIARAHGSVTMPSDFMLVAAMNPADTLASDDAAIRQRAAQQARKLSRPIMDRIDLWVEVSRVTNAQWPGQGSGQSSSEMRERVREARTRGASDTAARFTCTAEGSRALREAAERIGLSQRGLVRTLRVARTIALLAGAERIGLPHVLEALQYRPRFQGTP